MRAADGLSALAGLRRRYFGRWCGGFLRQPPPTAKICAAAAPSAAPIPAAANPTEMLVTSGRAFEHSASTIIFRRSSLKINKVNWIRYLWASYFYKSLKKSNTTFKRISNSVSPAFRGSSAFVLPFLTGAALAVFSLINCEYPAILKLVFFVEY
jgi:hypothetical protein